MIMASAIWPMFLDYSSDECKKILRKLELEAYSSVISAFRAQGEMSKEKKKMLQELSSVLCISLERHKAEIRRAVNDEHLNTIANRLAGPNTSTEWSIEGRRVLPLMPRLIPQTAFTALANFAADTQATKNSILPFPSDTGFKRGNSDFINEELELKLKRPPSVELNERPEKIFAIDNHSGPSACSDIAMEDNSDILAETSTAPQCLLQSSIEKDGACVTNKNITKSLIPCTLQKSSISGTSMHTVALPSSSIAVIPSKNSDVPVVKTVASSFTSSSHGKHLRSSISKNNNICLPSETSVITSSSKLEETKSVGSVITPLPSICENPQDEVTDSSINTIQECYSEGRSLSSRPPLETKLSAPGSLSSSSFVAGCSQNQITQICNVNQSISKAVSSPKSKGAFPRAVCSISNPSTTSVSHVQSLINVPTLPRVLSPVSPPARVSNPVSNSHRAASPVTFKQSPTPVSLPSVKTSVSQKSLNKTSCIKPTYSSKPVIASASKSFVTKTTASSASPATTRISVQTCIKGTQSLSKTISCPQKTLQSNQLKPGSAISKTISYRSESGLKIISQNINANWLMSKSNSVTSSTVSSSNRISTTAAVSGAAGNARIINFSQPINARFARASITSPSVSHSVSNAQSNSGVRVAVSVGVNSTPVVRSAVPAKPNVIVVHKAQVWPQAPGATIVMTSSGSLSRISNEAIEEAVTIMQRQETVRHFSSSTALKGLNFHQTTVSSSVSAPSHFIQSKKTVTTTLKNNKVEDPSTVISTDDFSSGKSRKQNCDKSSTHLSSLLCKDSLEVSPVNSKPIDDAVFEDVRLQCSQNSGDCDLEDYVTSTRQSTSESMNASVKMDKILQPLGEEPFSLKFRSSESSEISEGNEITIGSSNIPIYEVSDSLKEDSNDCIEILTPSVQCINTSTPVEDEIKYNHSTYKVQESS